MSEMKKLVRRPSAIAIAIRAWLLVLGALAANADGFSVVEPAADGWFNAKFLAPDGTLPPDVMRDTLHPDETGYRIWAESISKVLR